MLKQVPLETIFSDTEPDHIIVDDICLKGSNEGINEATIKTIIANNINIQIAIASIAYCREFTNIDHMVAFIGFTDKNDIEGQLDSYKLLFGKSFIFKEDNAAIACEVMQPFKETLRVFDDLREHGQLNKWVSFFFLNKPVQDCSEIACYQYTSDKDHDPYEVQQFKEDEFFQYMLKNERNKLVQNCIPVWGFTLQEIDALPYTSIISKLVNNLYVYISKETFEDNPSYVKYIKFITWD